MQLVYSAWSDWRLTFGVLQWEMIWEKWGKIGTEYWWGFFLFQRVLFFSEGSLPPRHHLKAGHDGNQTSDWAMLWLSPVSSPANRTYIAAGGGISAPNLVCRRLEVARSWQASQHQCSQAGDHLLSTIPQSDIWTWGNICPDSPGGSISTVSTYIIIAN